MLNFNLFLIHQSVREAWILHGSPRLKLCVINTTEKRNRKKKTFGKTFSFIEFFDYYLHVQLSL